MLASRFADFLRRMLRVDRQLVSVVGQAPALGPVKTEAGVRSLPAPTTVLEELSKHLRVFGPGPLGLVFSTAQGTAVRRSEGGGGLAEGGRWVGAERHDGVA